MLLLGWAALCERVHYTIHSTSLRLKHWVSGNSLLTSLLKCVFANEMLSVFYETPDFPWEGLGCLLLLMASGRRLMSLELRQPRQRFVLLQQPILLPWLSKQQVKGVTDYTPWRKKVSCICCACIRTRIQKDTALAYRAHKHNTHTQTCIQKVHHFLLLSKFQIVSTHWQSDNTEATYPAHKSFLLSFPCAPHNATWAHLDELSYFPWGQCDRHCIVVKIKPPEEDREEPKQLIFGGL